ncbi:MAG: hypothetical protein ACM3QX_16730 [Syntrophomonadaceae bacterium]
MKKYLFILFLLTLSSCEIFNTRNSEDPHTPRGSYQPATTTEILIQNLQNSFKDKLNDNYMACFSDKVFSFSPSAGSVSKYSFLQTWTRQDEGQFFNNLINSVPQNSIITLSFSNPETNPQGDSTSFTAGYEISVPFLDEQKPRFYKGSLHFTMIRDNKLQWVISYWMDIQNEQYPSWSELKGRLN